MEFEVLKQSHLKRNIIIGVIVVLIISAIVLNFTRAKYRTTQSIPLVNGTINYSLADLNIVAITVDGEPADTIPEGNYELASTSYCTYKDGSTIEGLTLNYDSNTKAFNITPYTTKGTKCYLDFNEKTSAGDTILGNVEVNEGTPDFSKTAQAECGILTNCEETNGVYKAEDDDGISYYFRGAVTNNYVRFAGYYWRITRINGDGSIRIIYDGTTAHINGQVSNNSQIGNNAYNVSYDNNMYVGYMYTNNEVHGLATGSDIKQIVDRWYQNNLSTYASYIDLNAGFCNDRVPYTDEYGTTNGGGTGKTRTYYAGYVRLTTNKAPSLKCSDSNDLFTVSNSNKGNKALQYPIGLITADEVAFAGGTLIVKNESYYLYTNLDFWTMSPYWYIGTNVFCVSSTGQLRYVYSYVTYGVRPVINLRADVTLTGSGTATDPYVVS